MDLQLVRKGLDFSRRKKKWILLIAAASFTGYGCYKVYRFPSIVKKRRRFFEFLRSMISIIEALADTVETIGTLSKDLNAFLRSDSDQIPSSLKQVSKIVKSNEFLGSLSRVTEAVTLGALRGFNPETTKDSRFADRILDRLFSTEGTGFASIVVGSFTRNLVTSFYSDIPSTFQSESTLMKLICSDKGRVMVADCIQLFVTTAVTVYLEKTMDVNIYNDIFSGMTNPRHETKVKDLMVSVCNGAMETLVKTSHQVLSGQGSKFSSLTIDQRDGTCSSRKNLQERELSLDNNTTRSSPLEHTVSSTLSIPTNRMLFLDVTGRVTSETVRSFLDFTFTKLLDGINKSIDVINEGTVERAVEVLRFFAAKSLVIVTICFAFCLHILDRTRVVIPA